MATHYEIERRRAYFFSDSFDEMVGYIVDFEDQVASLNQEIEELAAERDDLAKQLAAALAA